MGLAPSNFVTATTRVPRHSFGIFIVVVLPQGAGCPSLLHFSSESWLRTVTVIWFHSHHCCRGCDQCVFLDGFPLGNGDHGGSRDGMTSFASLLKTGLHAACWGFFGQWGSICLC